MSDTFLPKKDDANIQHTLTGTVGTNDTYHWVCPTAVTSVSFTAFSGAGAGCGGNSGGVAPGQTSAHAGGAGGGSAWAEGSMTVTPATTYIINVGRGGTGSIGVDGANGTFTTPTGTGQSGGLTSFTPSGGATVISLSAGQPGRRQPRNTTAADGGNGGTVTNTSATVLNSGSGGKGGNGAGGIGPTPGTAVDVPVAAGQAGSNGLPGGAAGIENNGRAGGGSGGSGNVSTSAFGRGSRGGASVQTSGAGGAGGSSFENGQIGGDAVVIRTFGNGGDGGRGQFRFDYILPASSTDNTPVKQ